MLAMTRHVGEKVMIDDHTEITVVRIEGDKVRLGFTAPASVKIWRKEIWLEIQKEKKTDANR